MARDVVIVCQNHFQGRCEQARCLAFRQKWLELACMNKKPYLQGQTDEGAQAVMDDICEAL